MLLRPVLLSLLLLASVPGYGETATGLVEGFHRALTELSAQPAAGFDARCEALAPVIDATHDLPFIARLTLGAHWHNLDATQQAAFVDKFRRLSVATYAARFGQLDGKPFVIVEEQQQPRGRRMVRARLELAGREPLGFDYLLHETDAGWRIVNILVDGVSDLALKRAEYTRELADSDFDALLALLDEQAESQQKGD